MCNIKTDWGIVVQQDGTANIFIVPLRHTERKITHLKLREAKGVKKKKKLQIFLWHVRRISFWLSGGENKENSVKECMTNTAPYIED